MPTATTFTVSKESVTKEIILVHDVLNACVHVQADNKKNYRYTNTKSEEEIAYCVAIDLFCGSLALDVALKRASAGARMLDQSRELGLRVYPV